jgi:hypothetical protein
MAAMVEDCDRGGVDLSGRIRDGHAISIGVEAAGGAAGIVGAMGLVFECSRERDGIGGSDCVRYLFWAYPDAADWGGVVWVVVGDSGNFFQNGCWMLDVGCWLKEGAARRF